MTKKKTKTAVSKSAIDLTTKSMHDAEILDFRMTKEDVIDLMVDQAERDLTAQIAALNKALEDHKETVTKEVKDYIMGQPIVVALVKAFGKSFEMNENGTYYCLQHPNQDSFSATFSYGQRTQRGKKGNGDHSTECTLNMPATKKAHYEEQQRLMRELNLANNQLADVKRSPRKLKVELTKKILGNTEAGKSLLASLGQMTKAFQQGLLAPQLPSGD